jgi:hypothetical protein
MMKIVRTSVCVLALSFAGTAATPMVFAQDQDHHDQDQDHHDNVNRDDHHDDSAYANNRYYKQGSKDGQRHKHRDKKWKNDNDRQAYEAGYTRGDHGDQMNTEHHDH